MSSEASHRSIQERQAEQEASGEQFVIRDVDTLKALADPLRLRLLLEVEESPRTVKEIAVALDVPPTRLYYHVKILEKHGMIRVAGRRMVSGIEERSYQATAKSWTMDTPLLTSILVETGVIKAVLDVVAAELTLALGDDEKPIGDPDGAVPMLTYTRQYLSRDEVEEVQRRIISVMEDFGPGEPVEDKNAYHIFLAAYRPQRKQ